MLLLLDLVAVSSCKDPGGPRGGNGRERSAYFLTSSSLAKTSALGLTLGSAAPCVVAGSQGLCVTPLRARGKVVNLSLAIGESEPGPGGAPAPHVPDRRPIRLFGSGEGLDRDGRVLLEAFDLAAPRAIPGQGALTDATPGSSFGGLDTLFGLVDVQIAIDASFYTLRFAFYPQPLADDPVVKSCVDAKLLERIAANGALVEGGPSFARGDVLVCEKSAAGDECAPGDFRWIDRDTLALSPTRPARPRQIQHIVDQGIVCRMNPGGPNEGNHNQPGELSLNGFRMGARLTQPVALWARHETCNTTFSTREAGATVDGTSLSATVNYDLTGFVFFPGLTEATQMTSAAVLGAATLGPLAAVERLGPGPAASATMKATVSVALGKEPHAPCDRADAWDGAAPAPPGN